MKKKTKYSPNYVSLFYARISGHCLRVMNKSEWYRLSKIKLWFSAQ